MYYDYSYYYGGEDMLFSILFYAVYLLMAFGFSAAMYVLRAMGMYSVAKNRELKHAWFAWVPVLDQYLLGCISDQYQYVVKGKHKNKRKILLVLNLASVVICVLFLVLVIGLISQAAMGYINESRMISQTLRILVWLLPLLVLCIAMAVFRLMALYDLYRSCDPKNSTMYLVLSILIQATEPFFIFFNRKKDEGMPPRRTVEQPVWEAPKAEEPWAEQ